MHDPEQSSGATILLSADGQDFRRRCSEMLLAHKKIGARRLKVRGHPGLYCGDVFICLDVNLRRLIISIASQVDIVSCILNDAPRHRWPFRQPHDHFAYMCFVVTNRCNLQCKYCYKSA